MKIGDLFGDRFELLERAGRGGMGEVWRAREQATGRVIALKFSLDPSSLRFAREAELLATVRHPALVGHVAHGETDALPWLAMDWIDGPTLADRLARAPLSIAATLAVGRRLSDALAALHARGVVHRDVKPSNVALAGDEPAAAVLLDLGVARPLFAAPALTGDHVAIGTVGYMAPEQARGDRDVDGRADVFALGAVLHECLTGAPAFGGENAIAVLSALFCEEPPPLSAARPDVPEELASLLTAALCKRRAGRPGAAELASALATLTPGAEREVPARRAPVALSTAERRLSIVAVAAAPATPSDETVAAEDLTEARRRARDVASALGVEALDLPGGALLLVTSARGTAADRARLLADALLATFARVPAMRGGLAAGFATDGSADGSGEVLGRALRLAALARGVRADAVAAELVPAEIARVPADEGVELARGGVDGGASVAGAFVGRDKELGLLLASLDEAVEEESPRSVLVVAPPGTGKTRLGRELALRLRARGVRVITGRAEVSRAGAVYGLLSDLVRSAKGGAGLREHVRGLTALTEPVERVVDFLGWLIAEPEGPPGPELAAAQGDHDLMARWLRAVARAWIAGLASSGPLALLLEDLHWSDAGSLVVLSDALRALRRGAVLTVGLARPEAKTLPLELPACVELTLGALGHRAAERLVRGHLGAGATDERVARIVERGEGNPLFLGELARFVADGRSEELPPTVLAVLEARLEELPPETRRLLRAASVLGEEVFKAELAALAHASATDVARALEGGAGRALIETDTQRPETFRFAHALIREAAYQALAPEDRTGAHARAAELFAARRPADPRAVARHWELAGDSRRAVTWLVEATTLAMETGTERDAFALAARGVELGAEGLELGLLAAPLSVERLTLHVDLLSARHWLTVALDHVPPSHPAWPFIAAGAVFFAAAAPESAGDLGPRLFFAWVSSGIRIERSRSGYLAALIMVLGLARVGRRAELERIRASCAVPADSAAAERALHELARCPDAFYNTGAVGVLSEATRSARAAARIAGDDLAIGFCAYFDARVRALAATVPSLAVEIDAQAAESRESAFQSVALGLEVSAAIARARGSLAALAALEALHRQLADRTVDRAILELAHIGLVEAHLAFGDPDGAERTVETGPAPAAYTRGVRAVQLARIHGARGEPAAALATLDGAEALLAEQAMVWQWEWLHATRASCLRSLGRDDEARAAVQAGLARLAVTLAGADDELRAFVETHVDPVVALRAGEAG